MDLPSTEHVDQRLESVPWDDLVRPPHDPRRRVVLALLAVAVAVVAASAARTLWPAPPLTAPPVFINADTDPVGSGATAPAETPEEEVPTHQIPADTTLIAVSPMSEADLRAVSPIDASRTAVAYAELFVAQWLTFDGATASIIDEMLPIGTIAEAIDPSARSFVESAIGMSATEIYASTWQVEVVVRSLSAFADGEYVRLPPRAYSVTVRLTEGGPAIVDLPSPAEFPIVQVGPVGTQAGEAPEGVISAARSIMGLVGLVDDTTLTASQAGDDWRVAGVVRDIAGVPVRIAVWLDDQGRQIAVPVG